MGEVIYLYRRKGLSYWSTCDADQYMGFLERPLFEVKIARNDIDYADLEHEVDKLRAENAVLKTAYEETEKTLMSLYNLILPKLRAERDELVATLESIDTLVSEVIGADSGDRRILGKIEDEISAALAKRRGE